MTYFSDAVDLHLVYDVVFVVTVVCVAAVTVTVTVTVTVILCKCPKNKRQWGLPLNIWLSLLHVTSPGSMITPFGMCLSQNNFMYSVWLQSLQLVLHVDPNIDKNTAP